VGPWEPTADLGQLIISDVKPEVFVPNMRALVQAYWERLVAKGACGPHTRVGTRFIVSYLGGAGGRAVLAVPAR
jgi:hypothetical protein